MAFLKQEQRQITVVVRGEGVTSVSDTTEKTPDKSPKEETEEQELETKPKSKLNKRMLFINATHGVAVVIALTKATTNYALGDVAGTTGDKNLADIMQRDVEARHDVSDVLTATTMGAWYGSRGGWIGALIGGAMALTTSATSKAFKYAGREREYQIETFKLENEINYARSRANVNLTTGRLR